MKTAYVFPGQGSQFVGMGAHWSAQKQTQRIFAQADEVLGFSLSQAMTEGTVEQLKQTAVTQPAIFLHSYVAFVGHGLPMPDMMAGHSLGEFSALVCAEVLCFAEALELVRLRAEAMQKACELTPSTMAAVLGLEEDEIKRCCDQIPGETVTIANLNCPGQIVISGSVAGVEQASDALKRAGARKVVPLQVSGAFHSPFMHSARVCLEKAVQKCSFRPAKVPIYQNVSATAVVDPDELKDNICAQLTAPVRFTQSIQNMCQAGARTFVEVGPGKVLCGLIRKTCESVMVDAKE